MSTITHLSLKLLTHIITIKLYDQILLKPVSYEWFCILSLTIIPSLTKSGWLQIDLIIHLMITFWLFVLGKDHLYKPNALYACINTASLYSVGPLVIEILDNFHNVIAKPDDTPKFIMYSAVRLLSYVIQ